MNGNYPETRAALDAIPAPAIRPVDLAAIYRTAHERQIWIARRWKRTTVGLTALAAGVILLALVPKLDVRCNAEEFAVRWGEPPRIVEPAPAVVAPPEDPRIRQLIDDREKQVAALRATNLKHAEMQELLLALTTDVADRDTVQLARIAQLARELRAFQLATAQQFDQTEKTNTTLYNAVFDGKSKPGE